MAETVYDLVIIGGGVSGLAAAMYAGRLDLKTVVIGESMGGTIALTNVVENYPGFKKITGEELANKIKDHAKEYDVEFVINKVDKVERDKDKTFRVFTGKKHYHTKTILFATGTEWRKLKAPGEKEFSNKGVHYCALCDGPFYKNKTVGVVGGSDSAAKEALLLTKHAKKVYIIYRGDKIRPEPINKKRVEENKKIKIIYKTTVLEIKGDKKVTHVILDKPYKGSKKFKLDGLFIDIGHIPLSSIAKQLKVKLNKKGEIKIDRNSKTNISGVFSAGDVADTAFKQAITGVGEAVTAAYSAYKYVNENEIVCTCNDED
jgi:thioredoxin reductase (NADPH)